jgi:hypothetical protein
MSISPNKPPRPADVAAGMGEILEDFDPKGVFFLSMDGCWIENPRRPIDCLTHEVLYRIWQRDSAGRESLVRRLSEALSIRNLWSLGLENSSHWDVFQGEKPPASFREKEKPSGKGRLTQASGTAILLTTAVARLIWVEAVRVMAEAPLPSWDLRGRKRREAYGRVLRLMENHLEHYFSPASAAAGLSEVRNRIPDLFDGLKELLAQETGLSLDLSDYLAQAEQPEMREGAWGLICEKLQPPQGIVTQTSPALLRPCLRLLSQDPDPASGISYQASVILSILQDQRSTRTLLHSLHRLPLSATSIRENLCYTLGNLREESAVDLFRLILSGPDQAGCEDGKSVNLLIDQKSEALRALGKIGLSSLKAVKELVDCVDHPSDTLKTHLAWSMGEIGAAQKAAFGGVSADILIGLLRLLKIKSRKVFEETTKALTRVDMPDFTHTLYLYNISAVSLLGLKPAQTGLFELSETIHHLIKTKGRAVIAVSGDSGTGKTYFCQSIKDGFGEVSSSEILYLMRDRKRDQKKFNRMLGLRWLKKHIDPIYYSDYPCREEEDDPEEYFRSFLEEHSDKKLIILDGCRDRNYFQRVIDLFYFRGELDAVVNLRAAFSSRRRNLEEREVALVSLRNHLSFLEEPVLEDTLFYIEGRVVLYDLDNSLDCRLERRDIGELFSRARIPGWGNLIQLGEFPSGPWAPPSRSAPLKPDTDTFLPRTESWTTVSSHSFKHREQIFCPQINRDNQKSQNFLLTIDLPSVQPVQLARYAENQVAGRGQAGQVFALTFEDKRLFWTEEKNTETMTLLGRDFFLLGKGGAFSRLSFEKGERALLQNTSSPGKAAAPFLNTKVITGHEDGTLRLWDTKEKTVTIFEGHSDGILSLCSDYSHHIYSSSRDGTLRRWDLREGRCLVVKTPFPAHRLLTGPEGSVYATGTEPGSTGAAFLHVFDFTTDQSRLYSFPWPILAFRRTADSRLILALDCSGDHPAPGTLLLFSPLEKASDAALLAGHSRGTRDCLASGPRILTCGRDEDGEFSLKIWGGRDFVRSEREKMKLSAG